MKKWHLKSFNWQYSPLDLYSRLYESDQSFFLYSSLRSHHNSRFSYLSCDPAITISAKKNHILIKEDGVIQNTQGDPFDVLKSYVTKRDIEFQFDQEILGANFFSGGAVGYWGYDLKHLLEKLPSSAQDDPDQPDAYWMLFDGLCVIDHHTDKYYLAGTDEKTTHLEQKINKVEEVGLNSAEVFDYEITPVTSKDAYMKKHESIKEYIANGDVYEVNLAQRFNIRIKNKTERTGLHLFNSLVKTSPSPFSAIMKFGDFFVISSSPERFLSLRDKSLESKPIKGTRPRRPDFFEDEANYFDLLHSEKDRSENVMIVDLVRNDMGRVSETGTVKVPHLCSIEKYSTVFQMVSTIQSKLETGKDSIDVIRACFPPGSMTGAPKIRAMEIIEELEGFKRGIYSGALGYIGYNGDMDLSVVIRTLILHGDEGYFQTGGAIVWDSEPDKEYQECLDKAQGIINALELLKNR